ncbi:GGDEF and EAL domain-containing protein [Clostridioides sp. ZZV15-6598]|uniref:putative bifunctional diguanylate cyclase/phosphodiesterase n=1 Tax=Clostridioides sp. ZZV15-6598 TaxID=2811501 RepID=UPI001D11A49A|nr:GGDEF and EAL domain-containing protein [Clostridioides sp. ZZV15-6598]
MVWHIEYEIFSAIIVIFLMVYFFKSKFIPTLQNKIYCALLICSFLFIISNVLGSLCLNNIDKLPIFLTASLNQIYLFLLPIPAALVLFYVMAIIYQDIRYMKKKLLLLSIPLIICICLSITNPFTHILFGLSKETGYVRGYGYAATFLSFFFYATYSAFLSFKYKKAMHESKIWAIRGFLIVSIIAIILQAIFLQYLLTGAACACSLLLTYLSMQNRGLIIDDLTGVLNRQSFIQELDLNINTEQSGFIITIALDDFKFMNETFGTKNGDIALKEVGKYLIHIHDVNHVYRIGGDIFSIVVNRQLGISPETIIKEIEERFKKPWLIESISFNLSTSIAVVSFPENAETTEDVIVAIDFSMHEAKRSESRQVIYADASISEKIKKKHIIKNCLKEALENDGFDVYYQPIFSTSKDRFALAEALIRLEHKELGFIPPDEFIPIAEQTGLINSIGLVVFEKVCKFIASDDFEDLKLDTIAVNLSVVQCMQKNLADDLFNIMKKYNVSPTKFKLEITETVASGSFNIIRETMEKLIDLGAKFALDDFGIGYSGVTNMLSLPFSVIKLDKSLIWSMNEDSKHKLTVETIISLINKLNMKAVAEGVETIEYAKNLKSMNCEYLQGYYFSKPVPEEVLRDLLRENVFTV